MAIYTQFSDPITTDIWDSSSETYRSSTRYSISDGIHSADYFGQFNYTDGVLTSGTLTGMIGYTRGVADYSITGGSWNIVDYGRLINSGNSGALLEFLFAGNDTFNGSDFAEIFEHPGTGNDVLNGNGGNDTFFSSSGNDTLNGGSGTDTANYQQRHAYYSIESTSTGRTIDGPEGYDTLTSIERLHFTDANLAFDTDGNAGQVYRLYKAAFARTPDLPGLGGWIGGMDNGMSLEAVANAFIGSGEFQSLYGANPSASDFVLLLYLNVLGRAPDVGGLGYWVNQIDNSLQTRAQVLAQFSESGENKNAVAAKIADGILYATADQASIATQGLDLVGTNGIDSLIGSVGQDTLRGLAGNDTLNGGAGVDTALYSGTRSAYNITRTDTGLTVIGEGTDSLINIERLQFSDGGLAFDTSGNAGQVYRLYQAAFDRTPDTAGLSDWLRGMDNGMTLQKVATGFIGSGEFQDRYGANPTDAAFVDLLYQNVLNRTPDAGGKSYWMGELDRGLTQEMALIGFSESAENQVAVIGVIQGGIEFVLG